VPRILVADDNANIQRMVALAFQDRGIDVISVGNGEAAVRRLPDLNPDLILADIFMPVRNGYEVCEWVKKDSKFSQIPVILLVGAFDPLDEKEARRVGADGVLKKPFIPPDPLIAMVTSVLEKNPAIAEELARAKNKKEEIPPAPPPELIEIPAKLAPKPLPEFPEPSPEEAELSYSFGTGRRALENEEERPDEPPAPKPETNDAETEEEFDTAATASDWRRSAMQFEVPEETSMQPTIASDEDLEQFFRTGTELVSPNIVDSHSVELTKQPVREDLEIESEHRSSTAAAVPDSQDVAEENAPRTEAQPEAAPLVAQHAEPELPTTTESALGEGTSEPDSPSKATHWMDMMASPSGRPSGDWFSSVFPSMESVDQHETASALPVPPEMSAASPTKEESLADDAAEREMEAQAAPAEMMQAPSAEEPPSVAIEPDAPQPSALSFADAPFSDEPETAEPLQHSENAPEDRPVEVTLTEESVESPGEAVLEPAREISEEETSEPAVPSARASDTEFVVDAPEPESSFTEPDLVLPPAVKVTPEPLLVEEEAQSGHSSYDEHAEAVPPLYSLEPPSPEAVAGQPLPEETPAQDASENRPFEFSSADFSERTPTVEPPNREALANIPFLNPPADFHSDSPQPGTVHGAELDSAALDAIVQRLFEKIEPQLHELLSQGVLKPLVQNILQNELEKKEN
jgi:CheY-like chemotaxis protein